MLISSAFVGLSIVCSVVIVNRWPQAPAMHSTSTSGGWIVLPYL